MSIKHLYYRPEGQPWTANPIVFVTAVAALVLVFALSGALWISHQSVDGQTSSSYLPPYFNDKNMHSGAKPDHAQHRDIGPGS